MDKKKLESKINEIVEIYNKGFLEESKNEIIKILKNTPNIPFLYNFLGAIYHIQNNLNEAKLSYKKAIDLDKNYAEAVNNLGGVLIDQNNLIDAKLALLNAIEIDPRLIDAYINLGKIESQYKNYDQEIAYYEKALEINENSILANYNIATAHISKNNFLIAKKFLQKTLNINPNYYRALTNLGGIFFAEGNGKDAERLYRKAISINPLNAEGYRLLSDCVQLKCKDPIIKEMQDIEKKTNNTKSNQMHINFALGNVYDGIKKFDLAIDCYERGNRIRKEILGYNIDNDINLFNSIKSNFKNENNVFNNEPEIVSSAKIPVFIVGMPRSGTTLIEQVVSSHSKVHGSGELTLVDDILDNLKWENAVKDNNFNEKFRSLYLSKLSSIDTTKKIITDKMPLNFRWIGIILSSIPEAKIIHIERFDKATMWSIYKHFFTSKGNGYAYNLNDIKQYYNLYKDIMLFWNSQFDQKIFNLKYEEFTENQEKISRELIKYLELEWEQNCLEFYNNKRITHTSSALQVRKKIYKDSSKKWQDYKSFLINL